MSTTQFKVYLEDTDCFGVVYHANYIKYLERGRTEWLKDRGLSLEAIIKQGYSIMVSKIEINYLLPAKLEDHLEVTTSLAKNKLSVAVFEQEIRSNTQDLISKAKVKLVALDRENKLCHIAKLISEELKHG